jgi:hypothetical protein
MPNMAALNDLSQLNGKNLVSSGSVSSANTASSLISGALGNNINELNTMFVQGSINPGGTTYQQPQNTPLLSNNLLSKSTNLPVVTITSAPSATNTISTTASSTTETDDEHGYSSPEIMSAAKKVILRAQLQRQQQLTLPDRDEISGTTEEDEYDNDDDEE